MREETPLLGTNTGQLPDHRVVLPGFFEEIVGDFRSQFQAGSFGQSVDIQLGFPWGIWNLPFDILKLWAMSNHGIRS